VDDARFQNLSNFDFGCSFMPDISRGFKAASQHKMRFAAGVAAVAALASSADAFVAQVMHSPLVAARNPCRPAISSALAMPGFRGSPPPRGAGPHCPSEGVVARERRSWCCVRCGERTGLFFASIIWCFAFMASVCPSRWEFLFVEVERLPGCQWHCAALVCCKQFLVW